MFNQDKNNIFSITRGDSGFISCIYNKEGVENPTPVYDTRDATATSGDVVNGKTAYIDGGKVEGTFKSDIAGKIVSGTAVNLTADDLYGATKISDQKFYRDTILQSIAFPDTVTQIGQSAFNSCSNLENISFPNSLLSIGNGSFSQCTKLKEVVFNDGLMSISGDAFNGCSKLQSIYLPDSVTLIGWGSFTYCSKVESVHIGNNLKIIENSSFSYNSSLKTIDIGTGVTNIYPMAFAYCTQLQYIIIRATTPPVLSATSAFSQTNNCPIYVPSAPEIVQKYKTATNWDYFAARIHPLSEIEGA